MIISFISYYVIFKINSHLVILVAFIMLEFIQILIFDLMIFAAAQIIYYSFLQCFFFNFKSILKYLICDDFFFILMIIIYQSLIIEILIVLINSLIWKQFD